MQNETEDSLEDDSGETVDYNQLCRNFVKMTESDMAVAHMYLQNSDWDLNVRKSKAKAFCYFGYQCSL